MIDEFTTKVWSVDEKLPELERYVLVHTTITNWLDSDMEGLHWIVACRREDEKWKLGNNKRPYRWNRFSGHHFFGQDVNLWCEIPRGITAPPQEDSEPCKHCFKEVTSPTSMDFYIVTEVCSLCGFVKPGHRTAPDPVFVKAFAKMKEEEGKEKS